MKEENQIGYYAIIPAKIRYDKNLKSSEKLLYGEITALTSKKGYCFATNRYFAELYNVTFETISRWISHLKLLNYINVEIIKNDNNEIIERRIYIMDNSMPDTYYQKDQYSYCENNQESIDEKIKYNNINNNINDLFNFIINKKGSIPKEFDKIDLKSFFNILEKFDMLYTNEMLKFYSEENIVDIKIIIYVLADITRIGKSKNLYKITREQIIELYKKCKNNEKQINNFYEYFLTCIIKKIS